MPDYQIRTGATVACVANTEKSVLELATPATRRMRPKRLVVGGFSVTSSDPPAIVFLSQYDTAAAGGTATTPNALDPAEPASLCTGGTYNRTALATTNQRIVASVPVPPSGTLVYDLPLMPDGAGPVIAVSKAIVLSVLAHASGATQNIWAELTYGE